MTDVAARGAGQFQGQPWTVAIPQPWDQQPFSPYEHRARFDPDITIDPGFSVQPYHGPSGGAPIDAVGSLDAGDHVAHGAKALIIPGLVGGVVAGALTSAAAPAGLKGAAFAGRMAGSTIGSVIGGAAMGVAVAASSPTDSDSLEARYALAGGTVGLISGAIAPSSMRGVSMAISGAANAGIGWMVGRSLETKTKAEAAAAAAKVQLEPTATLSFPTVAA